MSLDPANAFTVTLWRNGSASDSRSEGSVFESRRGHKVFSFFFPGPEYKVSK